MRTGCTQSSPTAHPDIRITIGADVYTSQDGGRLISAKLDEQVWGGQYVVELDNSDEALNAKDYKGSGATIYLGFIGITGSNLSPLWVRNQQFISREGKLLLQLNCIDAWGLLAQVNADLAGAAYNQEWQQSTELDKMSLPDRVSDIPAAVKTAITANYNRTIFSILGDLVGTIGKTVTLDNNDGIINVRKPAIGISNPISGIRRLLEMTKSYLLWKPDANGDFQVVQPDIAPDPIEYSYNVANLFFSNVEDAAVTIPNQVNFYAWDTAMTGWLVGTANDAASQAKVGVIPRHILLGDLHTWATSTVADLTALAEGHLAKIQGERSQGLLIAPMHCSQELFDKISIVDNRYTTPKTTTGYVHRIIREYGKGVYRITPQLGGVTSGYTPPGGSIPTPLAEPEPPAKIPSVPWETILPKAIQGYYHDIHFVADDWDTVSWLAGTIKFYDGTTQAVSLGNTGDLADATVRYIYFDLNDATPNVLKITTNYLSVMTTKTGVLCLIQKGSATTVEATVIPSYGKEPLITADVIYLPGLLDLLPDGTYAKTVATIIKAGLIQVWTGAYDTKDVNLRGWNISPTEIVGQYNGIDQVVLGTDGKIKAGAGAICLDMDGVTIIGQTLNLKNAAETKTGYVYLNTVGDIILSPYSGRQVYMPGADVAVSASIIFGTINAAATSRIYWYTGGVYHNAFCPDRDNWGKLGYGSYWWYYGYITNILANVIEPMQNDFGMIGSASLPYAEINARSHYTSEYTPGYVGSHFYPFSMMYSNEFHVVTPPAVKDATIKLMKIKSKPDGNWDKSSFPDEVKHEMVGDNLVKEQNRMLQRATQQAERLEQQAQRETGTEDADIELKAKLLTRAISLRAKVQQDILKLPGTASLGLGAWCSLLLSSMQELIDRIEKLEAKP